MENKAQMMCLQWDITKSFTRWLSHHIFCLRKSKCKSSEKRSPYARIDKHALNAPAHVERSVENLATYLIKPAMNDREKARAIYRWITQNIKYDTHGFFTGNCGDLSPQGVLNRRSAVCEGYARLFARLGELAGLQVAKINGYSKGYMYEISSGFSTTNHAWNSVKLDGQWHLLDATWGAGYLNEKGQFVRQFNEHYFLTAPQQFIYDHLPENPRWQLLRRPISMQKYQQQVHLKPAFFLFGLGLKSHLHGCIRTISQLQIRIFAPDNILLTASLRQGNKKLQNTLVFLQRDSREYIIYTVIPQPGSYILNVFAKNDNDPGSYLWVLNYRIEAERGDRNTRGFPIVYEAFKK